MLCQKCQERGKHMVTGTVGVLKREHRHLAMESCDPENYPHHLYEMQHWCMECFVLQKKKQDHDLRKAEFSNPNYPSPS